VTKISKVAVSFAWSEETSGEHKSAVERFCTELSQHGIEVVKDSLVLKYGDNLEKFMREQIGKAGYLCVFLSEAYLKSHNCMYELLVARMRAYGNDAEFSSRVKIWPLFDISMYSLPANRKRIVQYWEKESKKQVKYQTEIGTRIAADTVQKIRYFKEISDNIDGILETATRRLCPQTYEEFLAWVKAECSIDGTVHVDSASVFPNVLSEIATHLQSDSTVAQFLSAEIPLLFQNGALIQSAAATLGNSPDQLMAILLRVEQSLKAHRGLSSASKKCLLDILGGLLVLSVDPSWVVQCRQQFDEGGIPLPGREETASLGSGRKFSWLQLSLAALADSRARLDRVFLNPEADGRRVAKLAIVNQNIGASSEFDAVKAHLIRCVLGDQKWENVGPTNASQRHEFEQAYEDALEIMKVARTDERDPFYTSDQTWARASKTLRADLRITDLLLFSAPSVEPGKFLNAHIRVLSAFYRLFDQLK
jgi:hypothetical protein